MTITSATPHDRDRLQADLDTANALAHGRAEALEDLSAAAHHLRSTLLAAVDDLPTLLTAAPPATANATLTALTGTLATAQDLARRADGYTHLDARDMTYLDIGYDLGRYGWAEQPGAVADLDGAAYGPDAPRGWLRIFSRGGHVLHLWFTSPLSLAAATLSSRGPLHETFEVKAAITARDIPGPLAVPFQWPRRKDAAATDDLDWQQATAVLRNYGFTLTDDQPCDSHGVPSSDSDNPVRVQTWTKHQHGRPAPLRIRLYGIADEQPVAWYWAGRIRCLQQLARVCTR
ncbi:hypothetical protein [Nocardia sp. NRRL S-836]|uniref:hypothetical protein n=1 Tax=Nocardia sp. NRRL S-836 TaxID=1519492 RepID=UPI0006AF0E62|nr:hypothetical protein [Nocardia sp. NRRL S-836]KOV84700.1 hypothetical protein ADL03_15620 [Nocardia sp. NRRL S-836]